MNFFNFFENKNKEERFWNWFLKNQDKYYSLSLAGNSKKIFDELRRELHKVNSGLIFEFNNPEDGEIRELIISADGIRKNFPAVIKLISKAPSLPKWRFIAFRQRKGGKVPIIINDVELDPDEAFFSYKINNHLVDVNIYVKKYSTNIIYQTLVFLLLDDLVGEYDVETKIGMINVYNLDKSNNLIPLKKLPEIVDSF